MRRVLTVIRVKHRTGVVFHNGCVTRRKDAPLFCALRLFWFRCSLCVPCSPPGILRDLFVRPTRTMNNSTINTGRHVTGSDILTPDGAHSGYYVSGECILHGTVDTGFYVVFMSAPRLFGGVRRLILVSGFGAG